MNVHGREHVYLSKKIPCGTWILILARKPYYRQHRCEDWSCEPCRKRKTEELQDEIRTAKIGVTLFVVEKAPARSEEEKKSLSNFLSRQVTDIYWKVQSDDRVVIIAKLNFPAARSRNKVKYVIDNLVPAILKEEWSGGGQKRITRRQGMKPPKPKNHDPAYAQFIGDRQEEIKEEFNSLSTDYQRAIWLLQQQHEIKLFSRGDKIIEQYQAGEFQEDADKVFRESRH